MNGFLRTNPISRGNGQSAVACAAYRSGKELHDERYGKTHDYTRKEKIELSGIFKPTGAPEWMLDREKLWNAAEAKENRQDARVAREFILALPHNLPREDQKEIVRKFAQHLARQGMAVDYSLHSPGHKNDNRNFHAHFLCTTRECLPNGFGTKAKDSKSRDWNKQSWLEETRTESQSIINTFLRERGLEEWKYAERTDGRAIHFGSNIPKEYKDNTKALNQIREEFAKLEAEEKALKMELVKEPKQERVEKQDRVQKVEQVQNDYEYHFTRLTTSFENWKELKKEYSEFEELSLDRALAHGAKRFFKEEADNWKKEEPIKRQEIALERKSEPEVDKRTLFNRQKVEEQEANYKKWKKAFNEKVEAFNNEIDRYQKIRGLKTDTDYALFQKGEQSTNNKWYAATHSIKKHLVGFLNEFDKRAAQIVQAFRDSKEYWNDRIKLEQQTRKRDIDRGMSR
jgi:hypothetical protein